jgi:copper transport protein
VTPLPPLEPGTVSIRWRLVSPDGHPITGRVGLTIEAAATPTAPNTPTTEAPTSPDSTVPTTLAPTSTLDDGGDGSFSTPSAVRWVLRYASYLAIMAVLGILLTDAYVWGGAGDHPLLRRIVGWSLTTVAALGFLQALVIASDITGEPPWRSFGALDAATSTTAGMALMLRVVLAGAMWLIVFRYRTAHADVYGSALRLLGLALLATWAFAGHAGSMRWPELGVITDVAHHAAAALWIAGLAIVGWIVIPSSDDGVIVTTVRRFSSVAAICVGVLVVTGLFQSWRLVGNPGDLFAADHGRYLVLKVAALAGMLVFADRNRRRLRRTLDVGHLERHVRAVRRGVVTEFAIGLVIIAITAAMVVSPPATSDVAAAGTSDEPAVYYTL